MTTKPLVPLAEFNENRRKANSSDCLLLAKIPNGIACPICGVELVDDAPWMTLTSNPPKKHVLCPECGFRGHRVAYMNNEEFFKMMTDRINRDFDEMEAENRAATKKALRIMLVSFVASSIFFGIVVALVASIGK